MNDELNYCHRKTVVHDVLTKEVPGSIEKIAVSTGRLKFVPGSYARHRPAWLHPCMLMG